MTTKELVNIGQTWERNRGKERWTIRQVWRADKQVLMRMVPNQVNSGEEVVSFRALRKYYTLVE